MGLYLEKCKRAVLYFCLCVFVMIILANCSKDQDKESVLSAKTIIVNKETDRFIALEDSFVGEYIYLPVKMEQHPVTKEILILDQGNNCIYFYYENRKYLRKTGTAGQGPGDLLKPEHMQIDIKGDIYVYERENKRISIFDAYGKFITSFRILPGLGTVERVKFTVTQDQKVVLNIPSTKYYITIFDREGNSNNLGSIKRYENPNFDKRISELIDESYAWGYTLIDNKGNYVLFLNYMPVVLVFDKYGNKILEKNLENVLEISEYSNPATMSIEDGNYLMFYDIIKCKNNYIFVKRKESDKKNNYIPTYENIMVLDMDFDLIEKFTLIFKEVRGGFPAKLFVPNILFINDSKNLLFAIPEESEILKIPIK